MDSILPILRELGAFGLLAVVLVYIFRIWLPKRDLEFTEALATQRETFERLLVAENTLFRSGLEALAARQRKSSENLTKAIEVAQIAADELKERAREHAAHQTSLNTLVSNQAAHHKTEEEWLCKIEGHMKRVANGTTPKHN